MAIINITQSGSFDNTERFLQNAYDPNIKSILDKYGALGVSELSRATPVDTHLTSQDWYYNIVMRSGYYSVRWYNRNIQNGRPIAILLQYGHATRNGGWIEGRDYVMPAILPIFDRILADVVKEVNK